MAGASSTSGPAREAPGRAIVDRPYRAPRVTPVKRGGLMGRGPGTVRRRRRRVSTRAVDVARSAATRSVASYRRVSAGASASNPAAARTARSTEVGTLTPLVTPARLKAQPYAPC
jgi:hypothetical protein